MVAAIHTPRVTTVRFRSTFLILGLVALASCTNDSSTRTAPFEPIMAKQTQVVLRVHLIRQGEGSKYHWPTVEVLKVIKNETRFAFTGQIKVAHLSSLLKKCSRVAGVERSEPPDRGKLGVRCAQPQPPIPWCGFFNGLLALVMAFLLESRRSTSSSTTGLISI